MSLTLWCLQLTPHRARGDTPLVQPGQITLNPSTGPVVLTLAGPDLVGIGGGYYGLTLSYHDSTSSTSPAVAALKP